VLWVKQNRLTKAISRYVNILLIIGLISYTQLAYAATNKSNRTLTETATLINSYLWSEKQQLNPIIKKMQAEGIDKSEIPIEIREKIPTELDAKDLEELFIALLAPFYVDESKNIQLESIVKSLKEFDQTITDQDANDFLNALLFNITNLFDDEDQLLQVLRNEEVNNIYELALAKTLAQNLKVSIAFRSHQLTAEDLTVLFNLINKPDSQRIVLGTVFLTVLRLKLVENGSANNKLSVGNSVTNILLNQMVIWDKEGAKFSKDKMTLFVGNRGLSIIDYLDGKLVFKLSNSTHTVKSISTTYSKLTLELGSKFQVKYKIKPDNTTNKRVDFKSSNPSVVSATKDGLLIANKNGTAKITITSAENARIQATFDVVVITPVQDIRFNKKNIVLDIGKTFKLIPTIQPFSASNKEITWKSSNTNVATVKNGLIVGKIEGKTEITATTKDGSHQAKAFVTVRKLQVIAVQKLKFRSKQVSLEPGAKLKLNVSISPANATNKKIRWSSNNQSIVKVNQDGLITAISSGTASIRAASVDGNHETELSVIVKSKPKYRLLLSETRVVLSVSQTKLIKASILPADKNRQDLIWSSSNRNVASINKNGLIKAINPGKATIYIKSKDNSLEREVTVIVKKTNQTTRLSVNRTKLTLARNNTYKLIAKVLPENGLNKEVVWKSSNPQIAVVLRTGEVIGRNKGKAIVYCKTQDGKHQARVIVTVK
jgi:uncharacterized protein YjdB